MLHVFSITCFDNVPFALIIFFAAKYEIMYIMRKLLPPPLMDVKHLTRMRVEKAINLFLMEKG